MKTSLIQSFRIEHRLLQSPQMIQAMQILQLSALDLEERIQQELLENPFLEVTEPGEEDANNINDEHGAHTLAEAPLGAESAEAADDPRVGALLDELEYYSREFGDSARARATSGEDSDQKSEALANTPDLEKSLADVLIDELAFLDLDEHWRALAEYLLYSLDERGFLRAPLDEIAQECTLREGRTVTVDELVRALSEIRSVSHPALGAHDLRECLLLQVEALGLSDDQLLVAIVQEHLEDVQQNRLPHIATSTGHTIEQVKDALEILKTLEPTPGAGFGAARVGVILPDVLVEEVDGEYQVRLDRARAPELRLSSACREFLRQARRGDSAREWIKKRAVSARWFIDAVAQRQATLERVANSIFARQRAFLERGLPGLCALRMQDVAEDVGVHTSTVSRAVSGKYAQTPRGILPLKFFFTSGTTTEKGEFASQRSIKQMIAELAATEDPTKPFSDEELAALLEEREQVKIARRTITKYRRALSIPSSHRRKRF